VRGWRRGRGGGAFRPCSGIFLVIPLIHGALKLIGSSFFVKVHRGRGGRWRHGGVGDGVDGTCVWMCVFVCLQCAATQSRGENEAPGLKTIEHSQGDNVYVCVCVSEAAM